MSSEREYPNEWVAGEIAADSPFRTALTEIDEFYAANPEPTAYQLAERHIPRRLARIIGGSERDLAEVSEYLRTVWAEVLSIEQQAQIAVPAVYDLLDEQNRMPEMKAWMKECFFDQGLDREQAVKILKTHQEAAA